MKSVHRNGEGKSSAEETGLTRKRPVRYWFTALTFAWVPLVISILAAFVPKDAIEILSWTYPVACAVAAVLMFARFKEPRSLFFGLLNAAVAAAIVCFTSIFGGGGLAGS